MLTTNEICEKYGFKAQSVDYWRKQGHVKVTYDEKNRKYLFDEESVEAYIQSRQEAKRVAAQRRKKTPGIVCQECGETTFFSSYKSFVRNHLVPKHNMKAKTYYDKYLIKEGEATCQYCGRAKGFKSITKGYSVYCVDMDCRMANYDVIDKIKKIKEERYGNAGYTNPEKRKQTCLERYGDAGYTNREKAVKTTIERYGTFNIFDIPEFNKKREETCLKRYGVKRYTNPSKISESHRKIYLETLIPYLESKGKKLLEYKNGNIKIQCDKCQTISDLSIKFAYSRYVQDIELCLNCNPLDNKISFSEMEIRDFIMENGIDVVENDRTILDGKELDIYIPSHNIAIEYNGIYWHSSTFKSRAYHLNKLKKCEAKGIHLIQIFEDSWKTKQEIVKSMLLNSLGLTSNKIHARKCVIKETTKQEKIDFLEKNHLQGDCKIKHSYGLYYNEELVALMGFCKSRFKKYQYELVRYCNKLNETVVGGSSKLLNHFVKTMKPDNIVSYADKLWSQGKLYEKIGFSLIKESNPSYFYVNRIDMTRHHRFLFNKNKLNIPDDVLEEEYVYKLGYTKIFNCGNYVYLWGDYK